MTNEQAVLTATAEIEKLKQLYMDFLTPIAVRVHSGGESPTLSELLKCSQLGSQYFNFVENFVGNSGFLGAHANGKWVTGFAETCHSILKAFVEHQNFLVNYKSILNNALPTPDKHAYANMQRMIKEYLPPNTWQPLKAEFTEKNLPVFGFEYLGANDVDKSLNLRLVLGLVVGCVFAIAILVLAVLIPNPTQTQFFVFRGVFAFSISAISAIVPGLLNVESRFKNTSVRATGALAIFVLVWMLNPPALIVN